MRWLIACAVLLVLTLTTITKADPDLWGHLRFGLDTLQTQNLNSLDPYSFTQDRPWLNHEWLSEVFMALSYEALGNAGLALLKGALAFIPLWLVWRATRGAAAEARMVATAIVVIGTIGITQTLRPQLWSLAGLAFLCRALLSDRLRGRRLLPVVFAVWANLHGGWIVGLGVLLAWASIDGWMDPRARREWTWIVVASVAATLCTPYGWKLWAFIFETVRPGRPVIEEWQPLWTLTPHKWLPWLTTVGVVLWAAKRAYPYRLQSLLVLAMLACASLRVMRIVPLFVEAAAILLAPWVIARWPSRSVRALTPSRHDWAVATGLSLAMIAVSVWVGSSSLRCVSIDDIPQMPDAAVAPLLAHARAGRLVTFFNWGEYAIWHWGPRLRVSMDGRRETVYSDARLAEHDAILYGTPDGFAALERWRPEYVWLPSTSTATQAWLLAHGYRVEVNTSHSFLAVRADLRPLVPSASARQHACFPG